LFTMTERPTARSNEDLAELWVKGLQGDVALLADVLSPDARIWHSHDGEWLTLPESAQRMAQQAAEGKAPTRGFEDVRAQVTSYGVMVQAVLPAGALGPAPVHVVQVLTAQEGTVQSVEEYLAPQAPLPEQS
jgi:hypothetical protein